MKDNLGQLWKQNVWGGSPNGQESNSNGYITFEECSSLIYKRKCILTPL